jgi:hypothetical protein
MEALNLTGFKARAFTGDCWTSSPPHWRMEIGSIEVNGEVVSGVIYGGHATEKHNLGSSILYSCMLVSSIRQVVTSTEQ